MIHPKRQLLSRTLLFGAIMPSLTIIIDYLFQRVKLYFEKEIDVPDPHIGWVEVLCTFPVSPRLPLSLRNRGRRILMKQR